MSLTRKAALEFTKQWATLSPPLDLPWHWEDYDCTITRDGYTEDGTRIHFVQGLDVEDGTLINNAYIFNEVSE